jgi:hypothetical protein
MSDFAVGLLLGFVLGVALAWLAVWAVGTQA